MAALAERADSPQPWLFFREGIDWRWFSYRRVAERVARAAEALTEGVGVVEDPVPLQATFDVETLVQRLAARVAGVPGSGSSPAGSDRAALLVRLQQASTDRLERGHRPIVFAAPEVDTLEILAEATLRLGAAWALEPLREAFVATARWIRPTLLVAPEPPLDALADAWGDSDTRWSRLQSVVLWTPEAGDVAPEPSLERWHDTFGCAVT